MIATPGAAEIGSVSAERHVSSTLRFVACGGTGAGKSTLVGRLLFESNCVPDDRLRALEFESQRYGAQGECCNFALLTDVLQAEREQGFTIDVAYKHFSTGSRRFVAADAPGREQYTRNMAAGASTADLAVFLVDAQKGVQEQTRRHARIVAMMGVRSVILAVNKMDLAGYSQQVFDRIESEFSVFLRQCGISELASIPISALEGGNVARPAPEMGWYRGPALLECLETIAVAAVPAGGFCLPVQWVSRQAQEIAGFCGRIARGTVRPGDRVRALPLGVESRVQAIVCREGDREAAMSGESVMLTLSDAVNAGRGDVIVAADAPLQAADQFEAKLLWMSAHHLLPGRPYLLKIHCKEVDATVLGVKYREDTDSGTHLSAKTLEQNEIGVIQLSTAQPVVFDSFAANRTLGGFILIDKRSFETVATGMIHFALRRASNIHWHALAVSKQARAALKLQEPRCLWFTGLSGSGKSTLANLLEKRLFAEGRHTYVLDGDGIRHGLNRDLGFTDVDRVENIRRVAEVARLMVDAGLVVIVSFISPFRAERRMARELFSAGEFVEVHVDTPLEECERRDPKGLYAKARRGDLINFTGIDSPYEPPERAEIRVATTGATPQMCVDFILRRLYG